MSKQQLRPIIRFRDEAFQDFDVLNEHGVIKYIGKVFGNKPDIHDYCTCMSFTMRNTALYEMDMGHSYQCKHIKEARSIRFEGYP